MKSIILFIFLLGSVLRCSDNVEQKINEQLIGKWTWIKSTGGISGTTKTPETCEKTIIIEFTADKFIQYNNGNKVLEMVYSIEKGPSIHSEEECYLIIYENGNKQSVQYEDGVLILYDECYDCFQNEYKKQESTTD